MKAPDRNTPEQMNWVDYFDSLSDEYFVSRAQSQRPSQVPQHFPEPTAVPTARQEVVREAT